MTRSTHVRRHGRKLFRAAPLLLPWTMMALLAACTTTGSTDAGPQPSTTDLSTEVATAPTQAAAVRTASSPTAAATSPEPTPTLEQATTTSTPLPTDVPTAAAAIAATPTALSQQGAAFGNEVLFLRNGVLTAYDLDALQEREIATDVREFAAVPTGQTLALIRDTAAGSTEIWLVARDGSNLRQVTNDTLTASGLSWAPDGLTLAYAVSPSDRQRSLNWERWSTWCRSSEVRLLELTNNTSTTLAPGCDPAFSNDGRRIAFATPPLDTESAGMPGIDNTIRLVNRAGENGWSFATATGADDGSGRLVYAPAWSPDSNYLAYQRFMGYQALVDVVYTEMGSSFQGGGTLLGIGAGWLFPPSFAPDGTMIAVVENNYSDARGFSGYDVWKIQVRELGVQEEVVLPDGTRMAEAATVDMLPRVVRAAWSPDGRTLVVALPSGWQPDLSTDEPLFPTETEGDLWRWEPGSQPSERLVQGIDFASPLVWLPPSLQVETSTQGYRLAYPAGWQLVSSEFEERTATAPDGLRLISAAVLPTTARDLTTLTAVAAFPAFVGPDTAESPAAVWPDGSVYHGFTGTTPEGVAIAGAMRTVQRADGTVIGLLYRTTPEMWVLERAQAHSLLAASGS